tara:strand:- start:947 stop:1192 length:246 start_codon:yes stop_codon:yes gene_type:complete
MNGIDKAMVPVTIGIVIVALIPFMGIISLPGGEGGSDLPILPKPEPSKQNDEIYFKGLEKNIEEAEEKVRDLMAEHKANNP